MTPPQTSVATKNLSAAHSGTLPEGEPITGGHLHHPGAIHVEEGVVHPRGWGYVPVAMCFISLSLSCSWFDTILMYHELYQYSWILWCSTPSLISMVNWVLLFEVSLCWIEFFGFEIIWCMSHLWILVVTLGYLGDIRVDWCVSYGVVVVRSLELFVRLWGGS